ncbi:Prefoldin alpha-like - like 2 [Theobroma cacao]|nr:Prefoldin alpha-like - like 2 [Theobroma cacao]
MESLRHEKIQKFEEFVDRRLKPDLVRAIAERDKVFEQQKIFSDLRKNIENLEKNSVTSLRTLVNLGSEVYMQAEVPDTQRIFVDIGLGFHVEFTWSEALKFISLREEKLERDVIYCPLIVTPDMLCKFSINHHRSSIVEVITEGTWNRLWQIEEYTCLIASIKAQIKLVCEGIRELLQIPAEKTIEERIF